MDWNAQNGSRQLLKTNEKKTHTQQPNGESPKRT